MTTAGLLAALGLAGFAFAAPAQSNAPYAGQDRREIASLSDKDVADLLAGRGWGLAKAAELNGYPGPRHVLNLAPELDLDAAQRQRIEAIFAVMQDAARRLGADLIATEAALDRDFDSGRVDPDRLAEATAQAGRIEGELRLVHLAAHLETYPVLTRHQIATYNRVRGYSGETDGHDGHSGGGH